VTLNGQENLSTGLYEGKKRKGKTTNAAKGNICQRVRRRPKERGFNKGIVKLKGGLGLKDSQVRHKKDRMETTSKHTGNLGMFLRLTIARKGKKSSSD